MWNSIVKSEGKDSSRDPQPAASCDDERNRETKGKYLKEIKELSSKEVAKLAAQLNCLYINSNSLGNKQKQMEATVLLENHNILAVTEIW